MRTIFLPALCLFVMLTAVTGILYPLTITGLANIFFRQQASGSLVIKEDQIIGSSLLAQPFSDPRYFWPRPSAVDYSPVPSGASNLGPTSAILKKLVEERETSLRAANGLTENVSIPADLLFASASGLDPHISPEAAYFQLDRIVLAREFSKEQQKQCIKLIEKFTESPQFGFLGEPRVNVLLLNIALDELQ